MAKIDINMIMNTIGTELQNVFSKKTFKRGGSVRYPFNIVQYYHDGFDFDFTGKVYELRIKEKDEKQKYV